MRRLAFLLALALVASARPAHATPPSPPIDLVIDARAGDGSGAALPFTVEVTPRVDARSLEIELMPPPDVHLGNGAWKRAAVEPARDRTERFAFSAKVPRGLLRRVYVRVTLVTKDGDRFTLGRNALLLDGARRDKDPEAALVPDGAGGRLAAYAGLASTPIRSPAVGAATWIASGTFQYKDREQDLTGFTGLEPNRPARRVDVQVFDDVTAAVLATGATDGAGHFSIPVTDAVNRNVRVRMVSLSSSTPGLLVDVRNNSTARVAYSVLSAVVPAHAPTQDVDFGTVTAVAGAGGEVFNVFDVLLNDCDFFAQLEGSRPNLRVTAFWETGSTDGTFFSGGDNSIHLRDGEGWDDTVIGHEHGHFMSGNYSADDNPGGTHFIGDNHQDLRLSWSEGFATWFAGSARRALGVGPRPDLYIDTDGSPGAGNLGFSYSFETPTVPAHGAASEVAVTACLWDTNDDPSTADGTPGVDDDGLAHPAADAWEVVRNYLPQPGVTNVSLEDFWDGWFRPANDHGDLAAMQAAFGALDVFYAADAGEPDGSFALAKPIAANGPPLVRTFYPAGDLDFATFTALSGHSYVVETTDDLSSGNTFVTVYAPDQVTVVGSNNDRNAQDTSSRVSFVANQAGPFYVKVSHASDFGVYGSYALRVSDGATGASFTDVAAAQGVAHAGNYRGVAWGDVDNDGRPDLFVAGFGNNSVLDRNKGGAFVDRAAAWGINPGTSAQGGAFCDYDKDGDLDLFVASIGPTALYRNRRADTGDSVFVDASAAAGVARTLNARSAAWGDADRDGWADLFVCDASGASVLFRNLGNGTFADVTASAGLALPGACFAAAWCDYDHDGDDDLYLVEHDRPCRLMKNRLRETGTYGFDDVAAFAGVTAGVAGSSCDWGDFDNDGWMDLYVTDSGGFTRLYRNQGDGTFVDVALDRGVRLPYVDTSAMWGDFDNDQDLDLFVTGLSQAGLLGTDHLYEAVAGRFTAAPALSVPLAARAAAWADVDNDRDLDLYVACGNGTPNLLLRNNTGSHNQVAIALLGRSSNRDGFGATVRVLANGVMQHRVVSGGSGFGSQNSIPVEFGLGASATADSVVVDWPSGRRSVLVGAASGSYVVDEAGAVGVPPATPLHLALAGVAPNPSAGGASAIAYALPRDGRASLVLYSVSGRRVRMLFDGPRPAGPGRFAFDGRSDAGVRLAPGVFVLELDQAGERARTKLVILP